jgi:protein-L-isoaspartate(D-aspartate) O-methyltransferase
MLLQIILSLLCIWLTYFPNWAVVAEHHANTGVEIQSFSKQAGKFEKQQQQMVEQISSYGIKDKAVLKAMLKVPRHQFVEPSVADLAYGDYPLSLDYNQTISQPYIVAYMTEAAELSSNEKVLEIGTGSGYQAAVLAEVAKEVYSMEIIPELAQRARRTLSKLGYKNIYIKTGNGYQGWVEHAPYDAIVVTAAPDHIPENLINQLTFNGKMVIPVGKLNQEIVVLTKMRDGLSQKRTIPVRFVPMTGN